MDVKIDKLKQIIPEKYILSNEPMKKHTTFRIGGPADIFAAPESIEEIEAVCHFAKEEGIPLVTAAGSYGAHLDIMGDYDLVILAPQVASYYEDLKKDADRMGVKCIACEGKQYIDLTRNPKGALEFVFKIMGE